MPQANNYTKPEKALSKMNFEELTQLRATWLQEAVASDDIEACTMVAKGLGKPYVYRIAETLLRWQSGDVVVEYFERRGPYLPGQNRPSLSKTVMVSLGMINYKSGIMMGDHMKRACIFTSGDDLMGHSSNDIFVPGNWIDIVLDALPLASREILNRQAASNQKIYQELLATLTIGKEG